jgi:hypothetical protein
VLLDDLDLAVVALLDHGGVVGVDQARFGVQGVDRLVVGEGVGGVVVDAEVGVEGVDRHWELRSVGSPAGARRSTGAAYG